MTNRRVRIRVRDVEVELEGPESFLEEHRHQWEPLLALAADVATDMDASWETAAPASAPAAEPREAPVREGSGESPFEEYRGALTDYDRVLVACYHAQQANSDHSFRWPDAARVAVQGGLAASDAAAEFQYLLDVRHVMRLKRGTYRVSAKGVEALHKLLAAAPPS